MRVLSLRATPQPPPPAASLLLDRAYVAPIHAPHHDPGTDMAAHVGHRYTTVIRRTTTAPGRVAAFAENDTRRDPGRFATLTPPSSIERVRLHARSHHPNAVKSACRTNPDRLPGADLVPERDGLRRVFARKPCPSGQDSRKSSSRNRDRATGTATDSLAKLAYAQLNPGWPPPHPGHFLCQISEPFAPYRWPHPPHSSS